MHTVISRFVRFGALGLGISLGALGNVSQAQRGGAALAVRRPLAIEDYYKVKTVGGIGISADGKWVTFNVTTRVEETNGTTSEQWRVPFDGSAAAERVTDGAAENGRGGGRGGRGGRGGAGAAVTSADGKWVASVRDTPPPKRVVAYESDFEKRHQERFKGEQFDWLDFHRDAAQFPLPNNKDVDVSPPQEVFIAAAGDNASARALTHLALRPTNLQWLNANTLIFGADSSYRIERSYGRQAVFAVTTDGKLTDLTPNTAYDYRGAQLSPGGKWILVTRQYTTDYVIAKHLDHGGATDLVVLPASGGPEKNLTEQWDYLPGNPQWSPDGKYVYFTGGVGGTTHLFRVSPEDGAVQQMTKGERRIGDLQFDKTMTHIAYTVGTFEAPSEVWSANVDGTGEKQLSHINDALTAEIGLSHADRLQFKSADGTPIEGWILLPYNYSPGGGPYPLLVSNHGGPHSANGYGFDFKNQYFAANGYAVLEVNFRSSTGYGEKFLWGTWGAWGTKDGQDVMAGVDYALSKYRLNKSKVASIGHSYGGFMTNWLITQYPDRFAAAASGAGIVNWTSDYGNADIPRTKETEFFGSPWEPKARDIMIKQSPLTYADKAKAPTLFINGEIDQRVPYSENIQLYVALKKNGIPAKMIRYQGQPHGIAGSWNNIHRMLNERQWFDKYLKQKTVP
ncbi:MAG TPA: S9 family peptidase [Gemmataceae bacterium]|nr:S9 family peptidase [Gemmataceae bacterium]